MDCMHKNEIQHPIEQQILKAIRETRYGSVEVVIHDSRVVQIERKEKIRVEEKKKPRESDDQTTGD